MNDFAEELGRLAAREHKAAHALIDDLALAAGVRDSKSTPVCIEVHVSASYGPFGKSKSAALMVGVGQNLRCGISYAGVTWTLKSATVDNPAHLPFLLIDTAVAVKMMSEWAECVALLRAEYKQLRAEVQNDFIPHGGPS